MPIISTLTTVAAFVPLGLWPGVMGQFMVYFPITLSVVLAVRCL
jgi:multidrug efflux pump subunit AcrB